MGAQLYVLQQASPRVNRVRGSDIAAVNRVRAEHVGVSVAMRLLSAPGPRMALIAALLIGAAGAHAADARSRPADAARPEQKRQTPTASEWGKPPEFFWKQWRQRQQARARGNAKAAQAALQRLLKAKRQSGWPNAFAFGTVLAEQAVGAARADEVTRARRWAGAAQVLSPDQAAVHFSTARAYLHAGSWSEAAASLARGVQVAFSEPMRRQLRLLRWTAVLALTVLVTASAFVATQLYRHGRVSLHGMLHFLPRGVTGAQAALLLGLALLLPLASGLGLMWGVLLWLAVFAWQYACSERVVAAVLAVFLGATALALGSVNRLVASSSGLAADVYLAARDVGATAAARRLERVASARADVMHILALRATWAGDYAGALQWFEKAAAAGGQDPELWADWGDASYLAGRFSEAKAHYERSLALRPKHAPTLYHFARAHQALSQTDAAASARARALAVAPEKVASYDARLQKWGGHPIAAGAVPKRILTDARSGAVADTPGLSEQPWALMGSRGPPQLFAMVALGVALWCVLAPVWGRATGIGPACQRCGQPLCRRCVPDVPRSGACSECSRLASPPRDGGNTRATAARLGRAELALGVLVAGASDLMLGHAGRGVVCLAGFVLSVTVALSGFGVVWMPSAAVGLASGPFAGTLALLGVMTFSGVSLWHTLRQPRGESSGT